MRAHIAVVCGVMMAVATACGGKGDPGPAGPPGETGATGAAGADGASCSVTDNGDGTKDVTCGDATVTVSDGTPGVNGDNCTVVDNGDGTATITCGADSVVVRLPDAPTAPTGPMGAVVEAGVNYIGVHDPECPEYNGDCVSCHNDRETEASLDSTIPGYHQLKLGLDAIPGTTPNEKCAFCHESVDLSGNHSAAGLRRLVNVDTCAGCHAAGPDTFYQSM